jgi:hypothetical protein
VGQTCFTPPFFVERRHKMGIRDWDIVTSYVDSVTTSLKTVTFPKVQEQVKVKNQGNANLTYTIGSQSGTLTPGQSITVNEDISSFTIQAASGTQAFELRAKEKGTEQTEDNSSDVMSLLAEPFDTYKGGGTTMIYDFGIQSVNDGNLVITPNSSLNGTITNISVKEIIYVSQPTLNIKDSTGTTSLEGRFTKNTLKNTFLGNGSGQINTSGDANTAIGNGAMINNTSGFWNSAIGVDSLAQNTVGSRNIALGRVSLNANLTGNRNIAVGTFALNRSTTASHNIAIGADALWYTTTGGENVGVGYRALAGNRTGANNTAIGHQAGDSGDNDSSFNNCTLIGYGAGNALKTGGDFNTFIGKFSGSLTTTGTNNILIGVAVNAPTATSNYNLNIGNFVYGDMSNYYLSVGKSYSTKGLGTGVKMQVGRVGYAGYLELLKTSTVDADRVGCINFINEGNTAADGNTSPTVAYIASDIKTSNSNASGNSGAALKFFTKSEGGVLAQRMIINDKGNVGIGIQSPTALLHLYPGSAVAGSAPLKFNAGTLLATVENGAVEFDGNNLYITINGVRKTIQVA